MSRVRVARAGLRYRASAMQDLPQHPMPIPVVLRALPIRWPGALRRLVGGAAMAALVLAVPIGGVEAQSDDPGTATIAVRLLEPFVVEEVDGDLSGFSVELAREIAEEFDLDIEFVVVENVKAQLAAVEAGTVDAAIGAISITAGRERTVDFSQPMFESGVQALVADTGTSSGLRELADQVLSPTLLMILMTVVVGVIVMGILVWLLERRRNEDFVTDGWRGAFDGIWWSVVTLFTIGYGDKVPRRVTSRVISMFWMTAGVLLIATLTAEVTAGLAVERLDAQVSDLGDLFDKDVVTIDGTTSSNLLESNGIAFRLAADPADGFEQVANGDADAFVYDAAILRHLVDERDGARLAGPVLQPESYGIALPEGSRLREQVDRALLTLREDGTYATLVDRYFG